VAVQLLDQKFPKLKIELAYPLTGVGGAASSAVAHASPNDFLAAATRNAMQFR
jgi:hypothetical protein